MKKYKIFAAVALVLLAVLAFGSCSDDESEVTEATYYTVTFNSAGGSAVESVQVVSGGTVKLPAEPTRDGHIFKCWKYDGEEWNFDDDTVTADITLTAQWIDAATVFNFVTVEGTDTAVITALVYEFDSIIRLPSVIGGFTVIGIGDGVFEGLSSENVTAITVPETVVSVGKNAFKECEGIMVEINGALTYVGESAFSGCDGLKSVNLGEGLKEISDWAFHNCISLTQIKLPETLTLIGENAFDGCEGLKSVVMHDKLKLSNGSFNDCDALKTVYLYGDDTGYDSIFDAAGADHGNDAMEEARVYIYSETEPETDGDFWYYDTKGKIKLWK